MGSRLRSFLLFLVAFPKMGLFLKMSSVMASPSSILGTFYFTENSRRVGEKTRTNPTGVVNVPTRMKGFHILWSPTGGYLPLAVIAIKCYVLHY